MPASTSAQLRDGAASIAYRSFQLAGVATLYVVRSRQQVRTIEPPDLVLTELRRAVRPGMAPDMPLFEGARGGTLHRGRLL